jgi:hypothetical protein
MTEGQVLSARLHPATVVDRDDRKSPDYFLDWAFDEVKRIVPRGATHSLVARTTIDMNIQRAAEESLEFNLRQYGKQYSATQGAIVMLDATGFEPGGVAPFPQRAVTAALIDRSLLGHEGVWGGAGTAAHLAALPPADLARLAHARTFDLTARG